MTHNIFRTLSILLFCTIYTIGFAQKPSVPTPGKQQSNITALTGGVAHIGNGEVIANSIIVFQDGKITNIGDASVVKVDGENAEVIDVQGKHIYPGFIAANTAMGLAEIGAVRATRDYEEVGLLNPNVRAIIAYNTDSRVIPTVRSNGVLLAQIVPQGNAIAGQSSVVSLDAWNWEDAAYKMDEGIHVDWPHMFTSKGWWAEPGGIEVNKKYKKHLSQIADLLLEAKAYCQNDAPESTNLKLSAMCGLFDGSKKMYIHVNFIKEIIDAVNLCKKHGIKMVVVGGRDAWMATDILKENDVAVVLNRVHRLPGRADEDTDIAFRTPKLLQDAGIDFCITVGSGWDGFWDQRNLPFHAGTAVAYGLTKEEALMAITANPAKILGIDKTVGTLEKGKDATLLVSSGDVLDMRSSRIEHAFLQGRKVDLDNKQKALYRKFMAKYGLEAK